MNKSLRGGRRESSGKADYGFQRVRQIAKHPALRIFRDIAPTPSTQKKSRRFRRLLKLITGRRQTEWTGATRCPNEDNPSHKDESLTNRKRANFFNFY
jgi:hypothetical protein